MLYPRACTVSSVGAGWGLSTSLSEHPHSVWLRVSPLLLSPFHQDHIIQAPIHDSPALMEVMFPGEDTTQNLIEPIEKPIAEQINRRSPQRVSGEAALETEASGSTGDLVQCPGWGVEACPHTGVCPSAGKSVQGFQPVFFSKYISFPGLWQ